MKQIERFIWCRTCMLIPGRVTPVLEIGITKTGLQIWCKRHDVEVAHFSPAELQGFVENMPACEGHHEAS